MATFSKTELQAIAADAAQFMNPARLLYQVNFANLALAPITDCWGTGARQMFVAPAPVDVGWPGKQCLLLLSDPLTVTPATIGEVLDFQLDHYAGPTSGLVLKQSIYKSALGTAPMQGAATQSTFEFNPLHEEPSLYATFYLKFQDSLAAVLADAMRIQGYGAWREVTCMKTGTQGPSGALADGDCRIQVAVYAVDRAEPYWSLVIDDQGGHRFYTEAEEPRARVERCHIDNLDMAVPVGKWFKVEQFTRRSAGPEGRVIFAVDGVKVFDRWGPNMGELGHPMNRLMFPVLYSGSSLPIWQWIGGPYELWTLPPKTASFSV